MGEVYLTLLNYPDYTETYSYLYLAFDIRKKY